MRAEANAITFNVYLFIISLIILAPFRKSTSGQGVGRVDNVKIPVLVSKVWYTKV